MAKKLSYDETVVFRARKQLFKEQIDTALNLVCGRNISFYPYITAKNGKISEKKLGKFINDILGVSYLADNKKELYECFLYCAIMGIAEYDEYSKYVKRKSETFADIIALAKHKNNFIMSDTKELLFYEFEACQNDEDDWLRYYWAELNDGGFIRNCDIAYMLITGRTILSEYPDEYDRLLKERQSEEEEFHGESSLEETEQVYDNEETESDENDLPDEFKKELDEAFKCREEFNPKWQKSVVNPELFVKRYMRFRELFFNKNMYYRLSLAEDIEKIIDLFLYREGVSALSDEKAISAIDFKAEKFVGTIKREMKKRGHIND